MVGHEREELEDRREHLAMLSGDAQPGVEPVLGAQCAGDRTELDGLGTRTDDHEHARRAAGHAIS